ncbi:TIGR03009 domain-containing protein [Bremerella cremea]|uniref:TIGR03009 domain-containing protein n=1 Tax=Bremerella cremea TaxID=1031537 RepID=UPI0031E6E4B8
MKNGLFLAACMVFAGLVSNVGFAQAPNNYGQPLGLAQNGQQPQAQPQPGMVVGAAGAGQPQMMPAPFQINAQEEQYIDGILAYWEFRSSKVHHYEANFKRWEYDSVFGPPNKDTFKSISEGVVKYEKPDKGLFQVTSIKHYAAPKDGQPADYVLRPAEVNEHWVCDGKSIFEFDVPAKQLKIWPIPPEQQGQAITNGPLPFLFGAKKDEIKSRFYLRVSPHQTNNPNEYWLEAWPKRAQDAADYRYISILIDRAEFLPFAIEVFDRNYNPDAQPPNMPNYSRTVYMFDNRKTYEEGGISDNLRQMFSRSFYQPQLPSGWQRVVQQTGGGMAQPGQVPANAVRPGQGMPR